MAEYLYSGRSCIWSVYKNPIRILCTKENNNESYVNPGIRNTKCSRIHIRRHAWGSVNPRYTPATRALPADDSDFPQRKWQSKFDLPPPAAIHQTALIRGKRESLKSKGIRRRCRIENPSGTSRL